MMKIYKVVMISNLSSVIVLAKSASDAQNIARSRRYNNEYRRTEVDGDEVVEFDGEFEGIINTRQY